MKLSDWVLQLEQLAPPALAMDFDNVGLLVTPESEELRTVLVALDCTVEVAEEAARIGAELVLTHHPLLLNATRRIDKNAPETAALYRLIRHGVGLYAAHTNLDAAVGGVNDSLAARLGVVQLRPLPPEGLGRIGLLPEPMMLAALAGFAERQLGCTALAAGNADRPIRTVALIGGSGGGDVEAAAAAGADVLITGECKHHQALAAQTLGLALLVCGHYETERVVLSPLISRLQMLENDVQYRLTCAEDASLRRL